MGNEILILSSLKRCSKCGAMKPLEEFHKDRTRRDGLSGKCKHCNCANAIEWTMKNPEKKKETAKSYYELNSSRIISKGKEYYINNKDSRKLKIDEWNKMNTESVRAYKRNYKAKALGIVGMHTGEEVSALLAKQKNKCAICGKRLTDDTFGKNLDHKIPLKLGGTNSIENLQYLCMPCNRKKSSKNELEFMQSIGFLI